MEKNLVQARFTALMSQMNPHFLFNALSSIQRYMTENDTKNANSYLAKFSRLVRMVLENSEQGLITMEEELKQIRSYIELERIRFQGRFDYQVEVADSVDLIEAKVPTMMIQPFIENAIWHGLTHKKEDGLLTVKVGSQGNRVLCEIIDNGVGRKKSQEINARIRKGHRSIGMKNVHERIQLINKLYKVDMEVRVEDLYENGKIPAGTSAKVYFCPIYDEN